MQPPAICVINPPNPEDDFQVMETPAHHVRPTKPPVNSSVVDMDSAQRLLPRLRSIQSTLRHLAEERGLNWRHAGMLVTEDEIGINNFHPGGPVLIANVPSYLSNHLDQLIRPEPQITNLESLDLLETQTVMKWLECDCNGYFHSIVLNANILQQLSVQSGSENPSKMHFGRIVFCCIDAGQVALGGFWFDEDDLLEVGAASTCRQHYLSRPVEERSAAIATATAIGSPSPWVANPWSDEEGNILTYIPVYVRR